MTSCNAVRIAGATACAVLLAACGGAVGRPVTPAPTATAGAECTANPAGLPSANVVVDLSHADTNLPIHIRDGQTVRLEAEQACRRLAWNVLATVVGTGGSAGVDRLASGGVLESAHQPGTVWAIYRAHGSGPVRLQLTAGPFCPPAVACPLYARLVVLTLLVSGG